MNNREIKFRAITREGKIIENIGSIEFFEDGTFLINEEIPSKQLIEFTGLKDRNGKEIFEGDKLKNQFGTVGEIKYNPYHGCLMFCLKSSSWFLSDSSELYNTMTVGVKNLEVIGNIFENNLEKQ